MSATARRRSLPEQLGSLPDSLHPRDRVPRKVVRPNEEWIDVQNLSSRWFVIRIVQTHKGIPQKRTELTSGVFQLLLRTGRLDHFRQIRPHLQIGVTVVVASGRPLSSLTTAENRARHLEFPKLSSQRDQTISHSRSVRHCIQAVAQAQDRIQRNQ